MGLASMLDGGLGVRKCLDLRRALKLMPIAGAFCAAQIFALQALRAFDAGSLKIIAQANLPTTALLSWLVLGRRYSVKQWLAIALLLVATVAFLEVRMLFFEPVRRTQADEGPNRTPDKVIGMLYFLSGIALSCFASIFAEMFLKNRYDVPFYIQKTNLMFGELVAACLMVHFNSRSGGEICSWEQVREWGQLPVVLIWFVHGWIAGLLVKRCSALVKNVSHILSALVTYFLPSLLVSGVKHFWPVTLSALLVLVSVLLFATMPKPNKREQHRSRKKPSNPQPGERGISRSKKMQTEPAPMSFSRSCSDEFLVRQAQSLQRPRRAEAAASRPLSDLEAAPQTRAAGPPTMAPVRRRVSLHSLGVLVFCFIFLDATKPLLVTWAQQERAPQDRFIHGSFILVQTSLSLLVGLGIAAMPSLSLAPLQVRLHPEWKKRVLRCVDLRAVLQQLPCACCLCLSKLMMLMALGRLDAGTVRVFGQASLPLVGVSSALFFRKRYSAQQWCSLMAISVSLVTLYYVKAEVQQKKEASAGPLGRGIEVIGVFFTLASIGFNCLGALFVEKFLKGDRGRLHQQKAQLLLGEVFVNAILLFTMPLFISDPVLRAAHSPWERGFFAGWDSRVLTCAIVWIPAGWTATMLVKRCSNVLKTISQGTSSVLTYVFSVVPLSSGPRQWSYFVTRLGPPLDPEPLSSPVVLLALTVMLSALTFGTDGASAEEKRRKASVVRHWKVDQAYRQLELSAHGGPKRLLQHGEDAAVPLRSNVSPQVANEHEEIRRPFTCSTVKE